LAGTGEREVCAGLLWKYVKERNYLKYRDMDEKILLKKLLKEWNWRARTGFVCDKI
jgi:hypothetical protein